MNQLILAYHVPTRGEIVLGEELADFRRVPVDRLKPWTIGTGPAVRDWLAARRGQSSEPMESHAAVRDWLANQTPKP